VPLNVVYPASEPSGFHLMMNTSVPPTEAGKLTPDAVGAAPNVFIGTVAVDW
jgi:hypothetical protein